MDPKKWEHAQKYGAKEPECWIWNNKPKNNGYGRLGKKQAHVASYEAFNKPIANGTVDHLCQNKMCVNPDHLTDVTQLANNCRYTEYADTPD
jgi:hypothetical protein